METALAENGMNKLGDTLNIRHLDILHLDLNTSFERSLSKLPENHKILDIGPTEFKLWLLKDVQLQPPPPQFNQ